jgi:hypothetical protein
MQLMTLLYFLREIHSLTDGAEPFLKSHQLCSHSVTSQHFMEPEGSLPYSQDPSTGPHPEPDQSSPYHPILRSILILSIHLRLGLPSGLFPSFTPISYMHSSSPHSFYMPCPSHPPLLTHSNYTWRRVQVIQLLIMQFLEPPVMTSEYLPLVEIRLGSPW